jgi:hypothetical protein
MVIKMDDLKVLRTISLNALRIGKVFFFLIGKQRNFIKSKNRQRISWHL